MMKNNANCNNVGWMDGKRFNEMTELQKKEGRKIEIISIKGKNLNHFRFCTAIVFRYRKQLYLYQNMDDGISTESKVIKIDAAHFYTDFSPEGELFYKSVKAKRKLILSQVTEALYRSGYMKERKTVFFPAFY